MRQLLLYALATLVALILQTGVLHWLPLGPLVPDLVLVLVVDMGLKEHNAMAAVLAFAMGYATDACSGSQVGLNAFMMTLIFLLTYEASRHLWVTTGVVGPLAVIVAALIKNLGALLLAGAAAPSAGAVSAPMLRPALIGALVTALLSPLVFGALEWGKRLLGLPDRLEED